MPFPLEVRCWDVPRKAWVPLQGGRFALGLQASRLDTWIHSPKHKQSPDKGSSKAAGQRLDRGARPLYWPHPPSITVPSLDPPILYQGLANGVVGEPFSPPTQPHPLTPLLKEPEERREVAAQEHHHDRGRHSDVPTPTSQNARRQPSTKGCGSTRRPVRPAAAPDPGRGAGLPSRSSSHLRRWPRPSAGPAPQVEFRGRNPRTHRVRKGGACGCSALVGSMTRRAETLNPRGRPPTLSPSLF